MERETVINLASLAIIRAAKCETHSWRDQCTAHNQDCDLQHIVVCKAPSDMNIQMMSHDEHGQTSLHAMLHVQLKWDDKSTPFDCSALDPMNSVVGQVASWEPDVKNVAEVAGAIVSICKGLTSIFNSGK